MTLTADSCDYHVQGTETEIGFSPPIISSPLCSDDTSAIWNYMIDAIALTYDQLKVFKLYVNHITHKIHLKSIPDENGLLSLAAGSYSFTLYAVLPDGTSTSLPFSVNVDGIEEPSCSGATITPSS